MSALPPSLRGWESTLAGAIPALLDLLESWGPALARGVGPLRQARSLEARGEPDGFAGVMRRGRPEHLLISEWALAQAHPQEFLRRAAMGEQLALRPQRKRPVHAAESAVLLDMGPELIGSARLGQLALLLVLHRRAQVAGARLKVGVLQEPEEGWFEGEPHALCRQLRRRSGGPATPEACEAWTHALEHGPVSDLFVISHPGFASDLPARLLSVRDPLKLSGPELEVGMGRTSLRLHPLPPSGVMGQILLRPMQAPRKQSASRAGFPLASVRFLGNTGTLLIALGDPFRAVQMGTWTQGVPRGRGLSTPSSPPLAYGWFSRRFVWLSFSDGRLWCPRLEARCPEAEDGLVADPRLVPPDPTRPAGTVVVLGTQPLRLAFQDGRRALWGADFGDRTLTMLSEGVGEFHWSGSTLRTVELHTRGQLLTLSLKHAATLAKGLQRPPKHAEVPMDADGGWHWGAAVPSRHPPEVWRMAGGGALTPDRQTVLLRERSVRLATPARWAGQTSKGVCVVWREDGVLERVDIPNGPSMSIGLP